VNLALPTVPNHKQFGKFEIANIAKQVATLLCLCNCTAILVRRPCDATQIKNRFAKTDANCVIAFKTIWKLKASTKQIIAA